MGEDYASVASDYAELRIGYRLTLASETCCSDGLDDDADGFPDCADDDCLDKGPCEHGEELTCDDGLDNDSDGGVDCNDRDCWCSQECGLGAAGCCFYAVRTWCENGELLTESCWDKQYPQNICGWAGDGYACGGAGADPSGSHPSACPGDCVPDCNGRECGLDGCHGLCGVCPPAETCNGGQCECIPDCFGKECGNDGCGGSCGDCEAGEECQDNECVPAPNECGSITDVGCCCGQSLKYCNASNSVTTVDCAADPSCGWDADHNWYDCGTDGAADPSGNHPKACPGACPP